MTKKKSYGRSFLFLFLAIAFLTGCVKQDGTMTIDAKDRGYFTMSITMEKNENFEEMDSTQLVDRQKEKKELEENGYDVVIIDNENEFGMTLSKTFPDIKTVKVDALFQPERKEEDHSDEKIVKESKGKKRSIDFVTNGKEGMTEEEKKMAKLFLGAMKSTFTLELPYPAEKTNATHVSEDRKTLTWDIDMVEGTRIQADYNKSQFSVYGLLGSLFIVLAVGLVATLLIRKRK
jgi:multidrug efflux pump subunit AcrB